MRRVSPSQSKEISFTLCVWPLDSPFIQNCWRERLQKWVWPLAMVFSRESRFIQAIIRTRPVRCSWMMAGMRPLASNFSLSKRLMVVWLQCNKIEGRDHEKVAESSQSNGNPFCSQKLLHVAHCIFTAMENARGQDCVRFSLQ